MHTRVCQWLLSAYCQDLCLGRSGLGRGIDGPIAGFLSQSAFALDKPFSTACSELVCNCMLKNYQCFLPSSACFLRQHMTALEGIRKFKHKTSVQLETSPTVIDEKGPPDWLTRNTSEELNDCGRDGGVQYDALFSPRATSLCQNKRPELAQAHLMRGCRCFVHARFRPSVDT